MTKLIAAEVAKRNFIKKNGQSNENGVRLDSALFWARSTKMQLIFQ